MTQRKIKFTGWDVIARLKAVLKGEEKVKVTHWETKRVRTHPVDWTQGDFYEDFGQKSVVCFVGGLALVEKLFLHPGQAFDPINEDIAVHTGRVESEQARKAMRACADVVMEQFADRLPEDKGDGRYNFDDPTLGGARVQEAVIGFNDHRDTTIEDVYTVLDKAAVTLAEKEGI